MGLVTARRSGISTTAGHRSTINHYKLNHQIPRLRLVFYVRAGRCVYCRNRLSFKCALSVGCFDTTSGQEYIILFTRGPANSWSSNSWEFQLVLPKCVGWNCTRSHEWGLFPSPMDQCQLIYFPIKSLIWTLSRRTLLLYPERPRPTSLSSHSAF